MSFSFPGEMCPLNLDSIRELVTGKTNIRMCHKDKMRLVCVSLNESPVSLPMQEL